MKKKLTTRQARKAVVWPPEKFVVRDQVPCTIMADKDDLSLLVGKLTIKDKNREVGDRSDSFQRELNAAGFRIFECISDLGFFSWNPPHGLPCMDLSTITSTEPLTRYMDLDGRPEPLVDPKSIRTPKNFLTIAPYENENRFPYGYLDIVCLHVASKYRGINFSEIDFAFGGSTLEMLANCNVPNPFVATKLPGTNTILVKKSADYVANFADVGYQFERLMTGIAMDDLEFSDASTEHLHLMNVGPHRVLFRAEADAIMEGSPVEIKASNPRYWGTKVMFQMISNGSTRLCYGRKGRGCLQSVSIQSLQQVARDAVAGSSRVESLERNIVRGMESIREQLKDQEPGKAFQISFSGNKLKLLPTRGSTAEILPSASITREMIAPSLS